VGLLAETDQVVERIGVAAAGERVERIAQHLVMTSHVREAGGLGGREHGVQGVGREHPPVDGGVRGGAGPGAGTIGQ
jgi:hypothetical protein